MLLLAALLAADTSSATGPRARWDEWPAHRFVDTPAACLKHEELVRRLRALEAKHAGRVTVEEAGRSVEGRAIHLVRLGQGKVKVLLWSQMHGDEPSATPALLDVADALLSGRADGESTVLERLTLLMVPMLNPDGTEHYGRRNALGIDVNRDALNLATPEGRLLKDLRDRHQPLLGFNLHDQDRRARAGEDGPVAGISLLAVAGDPQGTITEGRLRAKRACARIVEVLAPLVHPAGISRYDEDWSPRAFGDNVTAWGTPVVLVESGGLPAGAVLTDLTRLNYVALLAVLEGLARDDLASADPALYDALPRSAEGSYADIVVRGGKVLQGPVLAPYRADLAFDVERTDAEAFLCPGVPETARSRVTEVGDAQFFAAGRAIDASGHVLLPGFVASVEGMEARAWLSAETLDAMAQLGVGRILWHVPAGEAAMAGQWAAERLSPGRPALQAVTLAVPRALLVVAGPPRRPRSDLLADALVALMPMWRIAAGARILPDVLRQLTTAGADADAAALPLSIDAPATFILLAPPAGEAAIVDLAQSVVRVVYVDGREQRRRILRPPP